MGKKVRSARGVIVDFDLMKVKEQIAAAPTPLEVKARQNFIENRLKRRVKKAQNAIDAAKEDMVAPSLPEPGAAVDESHIEDDTKEEVSEALAAVEAASEEPVKEEASQKVVKKRTTKQRARPKKKTTADPQSETEETEETEEI